MGQRILLACGKCGYRNEMSVGIGLMSRDPDVIASCLNQEEQKFWTSLYDMRKISAYRAEQKVFYCESCRELSCLLTVDIETADGEKITLGSRCGKCGRQVREIDLHEPIVCPNCGNANLDKRQTGFWD